MKGNLGFGCMRLPMAGVLAGDAEFKRMIDAFMTAGFNYFDTAHGYLLGQSEKAIRRCLVKRYPRDSYMLTNKLSSSHFKTQGDIRTIFDKQLKACGVDYFDFYLMHAQDRNNYKQYKNCRAYETALELKKEGLIRHFGISFHDKADVLDMILTENPEIEVVQIQFNYLDYDDASVESRKVYDVCVKHGKPVIVMEPVKGGSLVNLPPEADSILRSLGGGSNASYAVRFAGSFDNVVMVLSGVSNLAQMEDNISSMKDFKPLDDGEMNALSRVCGVFGGLSLIPCTSCRYCVEQNKCPKDILIPDLFAAMNARKAFKNWNSKMYYHVSSGGTHGKASDCIGCGRCEKVCPQHLEIRELLKQVSKTFD